MTRSSLGKRTRSIDDTDASPVQTPSKRGRRLVKTAPVYNDENQDPQSPVDEQDDFKQPPPITRRSPSQASSIKLNPVTPSTPRHRDALAVPPTTPRHAVMSAGKLFKRLTPQTPLSPSTIQTVYHSARQLFARGAEPGQLVGRESERDQLTTFLDRCSSKTPNGCLYVSGPPGTGKSAMITEMTQACSDRDNVQVAYINCMSIKSSKDLYATLLGALGQASDLTEADAVAALQAMFVSKSKSNSVYLITLDEIDHILTMGLESLYRVFEWSLQKSSRLVLVGVANALDLTDRFLPRLKSKNLKPDLMSFLPYTAVQVKNIIITRLKSLMPEGKEGYVPFIHPAAIELCSRKVSSQTGDLRKAFEICRRALDLIEAETRGKHEEEAREKLLLMTPSKRPLGENINGASGTGGRSVMQIMSTSLKSLTAETAPRASIGHLNKITSAAFNNGTTQRLKALNLQQKAALCALVACEKRNRAAAKMANGLTTPSKSKLMAPTVKALFDAYCQLCTRDSVLHPLSSSEFREVVGSLETLGLVNASDGKSGSFVTPQTPSKRGRRAAIASGDERRVTSCAGEKEIESIAEGVGAGILKSILSGESLD
ncbi:P-loop containing nucleoside triphosphate hydrolase protein [Dactylonectria macrodidyma]|uniref:Cell division control protein n=1 Tax=Dactylonectria macrodidyma TaxID=307937 RepID=A0A9P9JHC4_9HYPO|nr:P-loop containing nucleoside triphosphate hydrolase protein [Dactylonectria macrodidyma]